MEKDHTFNECFAFSKSISFKVYFVQQCYLLEPGGHAIGVRIIGWNMCICVEEVQS